MAAPNQSTLEGLKKLEEQITCPICLEHFTNPKVLPCFHSFCLHCLQGVPIVLVDGNHSLPCPTCRSSCPVPDNGLVSLLPSFVINNLMEVYELMKKVSADQHASCDNCDNTNADSYCKQCAKFLCPECLPHHNKWKPNAGHQILSLDEVATTAYQLPHAKQEQCMVCTEHHDEPLKIFCESCQKLICRDCTVKKHKDHNYDLVSGTYHRHKDTIVQSSLQPLNEELDRLMAARQTLANRTKEISQQAEATKKDIRQTIAQIKSFLDETEKKLMEDVDSASKHKVNVVDQQIKELDTVLGQVAKCRDHVEQCVKVGSPQQVLSTKPQIMSHTQSVLTSVKNKTFQPLEQADIELVKSDTIHQIHNNIGKVKYTALSQAKMNLLHCHILSMKQESTVTVTFSLPDGSHFSVPRSLISCCLTPPDNSPPIQCSVKESSQSGQYNVVFTPLTRGLHQLHVTVNDSTIPGSPVSVPVSVPPEMRGTPVKTITGLNYPTGVDVTDDGLVIVSEFGSHCITILDGEGNIRSFGSKGNGRGQLQYPQGVAVTSKRTILVSDCYNHRIQEFTMEGDYISCVGTEGNGPLQFNYPLGIAINKTTEHVLVAGNFNHRVQVLHPDLTFSHMFGSLGSGQGQYNFPQDVAIDSQGFVYVTDCNNHRVQKFTPEGQFVSSFGTKGSEPGQLYEPSGITVDDNDLLYVNSRNDFVSVYTTNGQYVSCIAKNVTDSLSVWWLCGAKLDTNGDLYIGCPRSGKVLVY